MSSLDREAAYFTLLHQVPCDLLCLLLLDGWRMAKVCGVAMIGFWAAAALIMVRRPSFPGPRDLMFLRWGFLPLFALAVFSAQLA